jgi:hypothetical protein
MSRTREDIVTELRQATQGPLGPRSLAGAVRKSLSLLHELRADSVSWEQTAQLLNDAGLAATAESIRRTVRREEERGALFAIGPGTRVQTKRRHPAPAEQPSAEVGGIAPEQSPVPQATGPPAPLSPTLRLGSPHNATALVTGRALLDQMSKLRDLNK